MVRVGLGRVLVPLSFSSDAIKRVGTNVVRKVSLLLTVHTVENEEQETDR